MPSRVIRSSARRNLIKIDLATRAAVREALDTAGEDLITQVEQTVSDWEHKPRFQKQTSISPVLLAVDVFPTGRNAKIFSYVDQGTKAHVIPKFPRRDPETGLSKLLKFRTGYSARTAPIAQSHRGSGRAAGGWVSARQVNHPGTEARKFLETFANELRPSLVRRIENAIRAGLRRL